MTNQYCTFHLGPFLLGVEVLRVQEVLRYQAMTRVPRAPAAISGLINLRGQIVTAVDLRRRLELPARPEGQLPMNVVVQSTEGTVSFLVDEIGDVVEAGDSQFEAPPETVRGAARELIRGVYKLKDHLLLILDIERAVALE